MKKGINFKMKIERGYSPCFIVEDTLDTCIMPTEDFYVASDDIWKKFELLPTPPRSPIRDEGPDDPTERLLKVTNLLDDSADSFHFTVGVSDFYSGLRPAQVQVGLKNDLLHDCMWSGQCTESCKKKNAHNRTPDAVQQPCVPTAPSNGTVANAERCVDPSSVLPYTPLSDHSYHQATRLATRKTECSESTPIQPAATPLREQHLGSDTPSDSDDEDDEIDVVNYAPKPVLKRRKHFQHRKASAQLLAQCKPTKRHSNLKTTLSEGKKSREDKLKSSVCRSSSSSHSSSDSEDGEKRSQHNSMERKRRDDLRYAFQTLRENVPELKDNPKAPKILILNQAATYVHQLTSTGQNLERTLKQETKRRHELQRRLMQLQRTKF